MDTQEKIKWSALEYEEKDRNNDWFWALGIIVVAGSAASVIFGNYFFAILLIISGVMLGFFAIKKPETIIYEVTEKGLKIGSRIYPYENIHSFWTRKTTEEKGKILHAMLFLKTGRIIMPIISVPIDNSIADSIRNKFLSKNVIEEEMKEYPAEHIMESLGF